MRHNFHLLGTHDFVLDFVVTGSEERSLFCILFTYWCTSVSVYILGNLCSFFFLCYWTDMTLRYVFKVFKTVFTLFIFLQLLFFFFFDLSSLVTRV